MPKFNAAGAEIIAGQAGATGPAGSSGANGYDGSDGEDGAPGPAGSPGSVGATGAQGAIGLVGADGNDGDEGPRGPSGQQGANGATGPQGSIGVSGNDGNDGDDGFPGAPGAVGTAGATGPQGQIGVPGNDGNDGDDGAPGLIGATGAQGSTGPQGSNGLIGPEGGEGEEGPRGPDGPRGLTGSQGPMGPTVLPEENTEDAYHNAIGLINPGPTSTFLRGDKSWNNTLAFTASLDGFNITQTTGNDPYLYFYRPSSGAGVGLGRLTWEGDNASAVRVSYTQIDGEMVVTTAGAQTGATNIYAWNAGTRSALARISGTGATTFKLGVSAQSTFDLAAVTPSFTVERALSVLRQDTANVTVIAAGAALTGAPAAIASGITIGEYRFAGFYSNSASDYTARVSCTSTEAWSSTNKGCELDFYTGANGSSLAGGTLRMIIGNGGNVTINTPATGVALTVNGVNNNFHCNLVSAAATSISFAFTQTAQTQWQIYQPASNNDLRFYNGADYLTLSAAALTTAVPIVTRGYTVAGLPAGTQGMIAHVTDALAPVSLAAVAGGGAVKCLVFYTGAAWNVS